MYRVQRPHGRFLQSAGGYKHPAIERQQRDRIQYLYRALHQKVNRQARIA